MHSSWYGLKAIFILSLPLWRRFDALHAPSTLDTMVHRSVADSKPFSPSGHGHRFSSICNHPVFGHIIHLLVGGSPTAVLRAVIPINVNAVNGKVIRIAMRHGPLAEHCVIVPLRADGDATPAVLRIPLIFRVIATSAHIFPGLIKAFFVGKSMLSGFTPTTHRCPADQRRSPHDGFFPTVTMAAPHHFGL